MKKFIGIAAVLLSTQYCGLAEEKKLTTEMQPQVSVVEYPKLRVGDVAPTWSLQDSNKKTFNSRDYLGQNAYQLLIQGDYPISEGKVDDLFNDTLKKLSNSGIKFFNAGTFAPLALPKGVLPNSNFVHLIDNGSNSTNNLLRSSFGARYYEHLSLISVDKAGFIRHFEHTTYPDLPSLMLRIGDPTPKLEVGKVAPDFSMPDMNGTLRRVSDLRGRKNLLLTFFPKCFTGGCTNHLTGIQKEHLSYLASDTEVWAVSVDAAEGEKGQIAFAKRWGFQFPLIPDVGRNLSLLYGAAQDPQQLASRMSVLIDKDGIVRSIDKNVNIFTHGSDMILQMRHLGLISTVATPPTAIAPTVVTPTTPTVAIQSAPSQTQSATK